VRDLLRSRDADVGVFARRRLTAALVAESNLVLTATAVERDRAISLVPAALGRTFTLMEFARLAGGCDTFPEDVAQRARLVVADAQRRRGQMPYVDPVDNDIADPPPTMAAFAQCAATIAVALETILDALCPRQVPADPGLLPA
jgi:protein-tyrosine phosphatase